MWLHSCEYLQKTSIKINVAIGENKQPKWNVTLKKQWNWSSCTKLALSASWTHGLIVQSVRASKRNSVVVGSNPTQAKFLELLSTTPYIYYIIYIKKCQVQIFNFKYIYIYIYVYIYIYIYHISYIYIYMYMKKKKRKIY